MRFHALTIAIAFLVGCASNQPNEYDYHGAATTKNNAEIYAHLDKDGNKFRFSEYSLTIPLAPVIAGEEWVEINSGRPKWVPMQPTKCIVGSALGTGEVRFKCHDLENNYEFIEKEFSIGWQASRILMTPFTLTFSLWGATYYAQFDNDAYNSAVKEAIDSARKSGDLSDENLAIITKTVDFVKQETTNANIGDVWRGAGVFGVNFVSLTAMKNKIEGIPQHLDEYIARANQDSIQKRVQAEKRNREVEEERLRQLQQKERELKARQLALTSSDNIGSRICKDGYVNNVKMQIVGFLDAANKTSERIQVRANGISAPTSIVNPQTLRIGDAMSTPGTVFWDDSADWYFCL